ncbi:MAG TPA: hypothetical protein VGH51_03115 [Candidatus Angelobacter sp.]|jgi:hypothetical protein
MKDYISTADLATWIALIVGQVILCLCGFKKHLFRRLPWFSVYVFVSTADSLLLFALAFLASYATYYHVFYIAGRLVSVLAFLTLLEFGRQVLPGLNLPQKEKALAWLLAALGAVVIFASLWPLRSIGNEKRIEVGACLAVAVAFIFIAGYSRYLGLRWSRLLGGVAFTLGLIYLIDGAAKAIIGHYPSALALQARQFRQVANLLAVVAWTVAVVSPWGEYEMTEEDLVKLEQIVGGVETNLRDFVAGGSR